MVYRLTDSLLLSEAYVAIESSRRAGFGNFGPRHAAPPRCRRSSTEAPGLVPFALTRRSGVPYFASVNEAPRGERARTAEPARSPALRSGRRRWAERALDRAHASPAPGRRGNREKERFALRAQHVKALFRSLETLTGAVNKEAGAPLLVVERTLNPKNLGGIEVPDGARLVLKFLGARLEVVVSPARQPGRAAGAGGRARDGVGHPVRPADPAGADWYDLLLREDGSWMRKGAEGETPPPPSVRRRSVRCSSGSSASARSAGGGVPPMSLRILLPLIALVASPAASTVRPLCAPGRFAVQGRRSLNTDGREPTRSSSRRRRSRSAAARADRGARVGGQAGHAHQGSWPGCGQYGKRRVA